MTKIDFKKVNECEQEILVIFKKHQPTRKEVEEIMKRVVPLAFLSARIIHGTGDQNPKGILSA